MGVARELTSRLAVGADFSKVAYRDIPFRFRGNPNIGPGLPRRFPDFGNFRIWYRRWDRRLHGRQFHRAGQAVQPLHASGVLHAFGNHGNVLSGADEFRLSNLDYQPDLAIGRDVSVNPLNPVRDACIGPLNTDARHRLTVAGVYTFPI